MVVVDSQQQSNMVKLAAGETEEQRQRSKAEFLTDCFSLRDALADKANLNNFFLGAKN